MKPLDTTPEEVLRNAIADEIASRDFYERLALRIVDRKAKARALKLADEQLTHRGQLERKYREMIGREPVVGEMTPRPLPNDAATADLQRVLKIALEHEREAESNFRFLAERVPGTELGTLFLELAEIEWQHKTEIQNEYYAVTGPEEFLLDM